MQLDLSKIRSCRAIAQKWIVEHLHYCDPFLGTTQAEVLFRRKCFNELALFLMVQESFPAFESTESNTIREFIATKVNDDYLSLAARRSETLLMFTNALAYAVESKSLSFEQNNFVRTILSSKFAWGIDGSAFRYLELLCACRYSGAACLLSTDDVFRTSALAVAPSPIHGSRNAFYALTHAEIYRFLLKYPTDKDGKGLDVAFKGGMGRFLANKDMDLGLELVTASLLHTGKFEPESVLLLEATVESLLATGTMHSSVDGAAIGDFVAAVPAQTSWAKTFHVTLVAALALTAAEYFCDENAFTLNIAERENTRRVGEAISAFHKYHFVNGIQKIEGLDDLNNGQSILLREITDFLIFSQRSTGQFGHLVDELALYRKLKPDAPEDANPSEPVDLACRKFLKSNVGMRFQ